MPPDRRWDTLADPVKARDAATLPQPWGATLVFRLRFSGTGTKLDAHRRAFRALEDAYKALEADALIEITDWKTDVKEGIGARID